MPQSSSLTGLLYRYLFFGWLFRDASRGSMLERAAAWRHNQANARWLPTYLRRWAVLGLGCFTLGWVVEAIAPLSPLQLVFYVPSAVSVPMNAVTLAAWIGMKVLPGPL